MLAMELLNPQILDPRIPIQRSAQSIGALWITKILSPQPCIIPSKHGAGSNPGSPAKNPDYFTCVITTVHVACTIKVQLKYRRMRLYGVAIININFKISKTSRGKETFLARAVKSITRRNFVFKNNVSK